MVVADRVRSLLQQLFYNTSIEDDRYENMSLGDLPASEEFLPQPAGFTFKDHPLFALWSSCSILAAVTSHCHHSDRGEARVTRNESMPNQQLGKLGVGLGH